MICNGVLLLWERPPVLIQDLPVYDIGVVLSGVTVPDKSPHDRVYIPYGADRILHTVMLYKMGKVKKILISGESGRISKVYETESEQMKKVFLICGVSEKDIIIENRSRNTHENALYTKELLKGSKEKLLLITSAFHMRRAEACFKKVGLEVDIFPVDFLSHDSNLWVPSQILVPSESAIGIWVPLLHEIEGYIIYSIMGYV